MHRHGYKGVKLSRGRDQRAAVMRGLATSLIEHQSIETTTVKAKAIRPYVEKLITKAKKGDLHNRRQIAATLHDEFATKLLVDEIAPKLGGRDSGYLRIESTRNRRGDNAPMARISFVDDLSVSEKPAAKPAEAKKPAAAKTEKADKPAEKAASAKTEDKKAEDK